jgi:hypothetical protein
MSRSRIAPAGLLVLLLAGCGDGANDPSTKKDDAAAEADARARGRDTDKTVFDDMIQTQDKARAVEGVTMAHKADLDKAIDESSGNGDAAQDSADE